MVPFVLTLLYQKFNFYDVFKYKINTPIEFNEVHKIYNKYNWSKWVHNIKTFDKNGTLRFTETTKKRVEKGQKIFIRPRIDLIKHYLIYPVWEPIQFCLGLNIMNYYDKCNPDAQK